MATAKLLRNGVSPAEPGGSRTEMSPRFTVIACALVFLTACASMPAVVKRLDLPTGSEIAILGFRDCTIAGQEDCDGSGNVASAIFARVFSLSPRFRAVPLSRPIGPKEPLTDDAAVAFAQSKGYPFVLNGEVDEYYAVAPFTFRTDRAGVSIRILRVADGAVVAFFSQRKEARSNLSAPDKIVEGMAKHVRDSL